MDTYLIDIVCVWLSFSYMPHFLSVTVRCMGRKREKKEMHLQFYLKFIQLVIFFYLKL